jgi:hypothetical protein
MYWLYAKWQKNYSHAHRSNYGVVCGQGPPQRCILLHLQCYLVVGEVTEGLDGNGCFRLGVRAILISGKFPHTVSQLLQAVLSKEQQRCDRNQLSIHPQKFQHRDQHYMKPGHYDEICWLDIALW